MNSDKPKQKQEGADRSAFQIGDKPGEGGQRDIQDELRDHDELAGGIHRHGRDRRAGFRQGRAGRARSADENDRLSSFRS